jgi:squalene-associated FAD-dependent desaturase
MSDRPWAVVGGGAAGLAAAEALLSEGRRVVLLERRPHLGGRVCSFRDPGTGWLLENGQHLWMPACTEWAALLERTGTESLTRTQPRLRVTFLERGRPAGVLEAARLPGPLGLLAALLRFTPLTPAERRRLLRGLFALRREGPRLRRTGGNERFSDWLDRHGQTGRVRDLFWAPVVLSVLNTPLEEARADLAAMAVHEPFLTGSGRANLARTVVPHGRLWERLADHLTGRGLILRTGCPVRGLRFGEAAAGPELDALLLPGGEVLAVAGAVVAVPPEALTAILPPAWRERPPFASGRRLSWSPILNVHLWLDRAVTGEEALCLIGSPVQWIFTRPTQQAEGGGRPLPAGAQHLDLVVSASDEWLDRTPAEIVPRFTEELRALLPKAREAVLLAHRVVHERRATWRALPGSEAHRPGPATPIRNLALAGAWTASGWPATIEGAVRSGRAAVRALGVQPG